MLTIEGLIDKDFQFVINWQLTGKDGRTIGGPFVPQAGLYVPSLHGRSHVSATCDHSSRGHSRLSLPSLAGRAVDPTHMLSWEARMVPHVQDEGL